MSMLNDILKANEAFVKSKPGLPPLSKVPSRQMVIFTCMDTRLIDFLEPAMGIKRGEVKVIKNAGNTIVDDRGGVIRSLVVAVFLLGCKEIYVIGHKDCGMAHVNLEGLKKSMVERGIDPEEIDKISDLEQWIGSFADPAANVRATAAVIRNNPLIPGMSWSTVFSSTPTPAGWN